MLKINKKLEYSLIVLKFLGDHPEGEIISAREICEYFNMPFDTTAKVMQSMNNHGILKSVQGIKGGYLLSKDLNEITFSELVEMIEGKSSKNFCLAHKKVCNIHSKCNIKSPIDRLNKKLNLHLENISLKEILFDEVTNKGSN